MDHIRRPHKLKLFPTTSSTRTKCTSRKTNQQTR